MSEKAFRGRDDECDTAKSEDAYLFEQIKDPKQVTSSSGNQQSNNLDEIVAADARQDIELKQQVYQWVSAIVTLQIIASNIILFCYLAIASIGRLDFSPTVINWWISGTVVETLGLAFVIVRYLFRDRKS